MRLLEVIQRSTAFLQGRGVESPRLQVEWILAHVLRVPRLQLYLQFDRVLDPETSGAVRDAVVRRGQREPLQHILGTASFCGLEIGVSREVLVPRPETEVLAESAWTWLEARFPAPTTSPRGLDWGTGSGCLAIAIAARHATVRMTAIDVSSACLEVARGNAARHRLEDRIAFLQGDGTEALCSEDRFDLVVANPPYIPTAEIEGLEPEVKDYDPRLALDGGPDGLAVYRRMAASLPARLRIGGTLFAEFGDDQGAAVSTIFIDGGWVVRGVRCDHSGRERYLVAEISRG